jgi:hypothetical protein
MGIVDQVCDHGKAVETANRLAQLALEKPTHSASPESRAAREAALKRRSK